MSIGKDKLNFDPTSADTLAASDTIGSYTLDGTGTGITSTTVGGKQGLDVNLIDGSISVDLDGIYNVSTNPTPDNVGMIGFVRNATPGLAQQTFTFTGGQADSDAVVSANVWAQDVNGFNMLYNGTTWDRWQGTAGSANVSITSSSGTITVSDAALANTAMKSSALSATTTAADLGTPLPARKYLAVQNLGGSALFFGDSSVTAATGLRLANGAMLEGLRMGPALSPKVITSSGTADTRIFELS